MSVEITFNDMIKALRSGDSAAEEQLWLQFSSRIQGLARNYLPPNHRRMSDESDVAVSVLESVLSGIQNDRYSHLEGPENLWNLVATITKFKAIEHRRRATNERNQSPHEAVAGESAIAGPPNSAIGASPIEQIPDRRCGPDEIAAAADEFLHLLELLDDSMDRSIVLLRIGSELDSDIPGLGGGQRSVQEIADLLDAPKRTIERRIQNIRFKWAAYFERQKNGDA